MRIRRSREIAKCDPRHTPWGKYGLRSLAYQDTCRTCAAHSSTAAKVRPRSRWMRSGVVNYRTGRTTLQHLAHSVGNDCILAERHAHQCLVKAKGTQDRKRIGGWFPGQLIGRGDDAASAGFD